MSKIKYQIWNGLYEEPFDNKIFDTHEEMEKYFEDNIQKINEICDNYYGKPTDPKDCFFLDEVKV